jgi:TolA-binding protein
MRGSGAVTKRLTKEELKEDRVMVAVTQAADYARSNARWIAGGAGLVAVIIVVAILIMQGRMKAEQSAGLGMAQAQSLYFSGDYTQASTQFQSVIDRYGSSRAAKTALLFQGNCLLALGNNAGAEQALRKFLSKGKLDPVQEAGAHRGVGGALVGQQKYAEGAEAFAAAGKVAGNPLAGDDWLQAGLAYASAGRKDDAAKAFQKVLDDFPQSQSVTEARERLQETLAVR